MAEPGHLNSHQRDTLAQIFRHPLSHNIEWHSILALLHAVATVQETHKGHVVVTIGDAERDLRSPAPQGHRRGAADQSAPTPPRGRIRARGGPGLATTESARVSHARRGRLADMRTRE